MTLYRRGLDALAGRLMASGRYSDQTGVRYACAVFLIGPFYAAIGGGIVYAVSQNGQFTMLAGTALWGATYVAANLLLSVLRSQSRRGIRAPLDVESVGRLSIQALVSLSDDVDEQRRIIDEEIQRRSALTLLDYQRHHGKWL